VYGRSTCAVSNTIIKVHTNINSRSYYSLWNFMNIISVLVIGFNFATLYSLRMACLYQHVVA
jgi:hypothetical protein